MAQTALQQMQHQIVNRRPGSSGYVTSGRELKAILNELTELVPVGIQGTGEPKNGLLDYTITVGFSLEPEFLMNPTAPKDTLVERLERAGNDPEQYDLVEPVAKLLREAAAALKAAKQ